jgi:endo-beta-N-acetylglucosaminidase D
LKYFRLKVYFYEIIFRKNDTVLKKITLLSTLLFGGSLFAQIINTAPYILTIPELKAWTQDGPTASADLISTVPLATRFTNTATQFNPELNSNMQIAYLPDGMNNFGNYHGEQGQFNLYNFTHWQYIDKFVWFGGTSTQTVQLPSSPWANAAHKNGVKIFGDIFFSPTSYGGSTATLQSFLEQDGSGNFIVIPKLVAMMQYYKFDGWFINQETATTSAVAALMHDFVRDLTAQLEALGKEVMWYDAMRLTGAVGWQNRLNANNSPFLQDDQDGNTANGYETRVSSSMFINFFWSGSSYPTLSRTRARTIGRSEFDVFTGADIWPGRNQGNFATYGNAFMNGLHEDDTTPYTSLGLFATNCLYNYSGFTNFNNDPNDVDSFYSSENHLFGGYDRNPATVDATNFKGLSNWIPETSVITAMPFETNFSTGHGRRKFVNGDITEVTDWHDMNQQSILPTWTWAFSPGALLEAKWDFDDAYNGGNSIKITGAVMSDAPADLMLYKTKLTVVPGTVIDVITRTASYKKLLVVFADNPTQRVEFDMTEPPNTLWRTEKVVLPPSYNGKEIAAIGLRFSPEQSQSGYSASFGGLKVYQDEELATQAYDMGKQLVTVIYPQDGGVAFSINKPASDKITFTIFDLQGKVIRNGSFAANGATYKPETSGLSSGMYLVKFTDARNMTDTQKIFIK